MILQNDADDFFPAFPLWQSLGRLGHKNRAASPDKRMQPLEWTIIKKYSLFDVFPNLGEVVLHGLFIVRSDDVNQFLEFLTDLLHLIFGARII